MKLIEINLRPTDRQLRQFGIVCAVLLSVGAGYWGKGRPWGIAGLVTLALVVGVIGWFWPRVLKPVFIGLSIAVAPLGLVFGELAMLLIFFGVFLPMGLVFRALGRDNLRLRRDPHATTYWQSKPQPRDMASYYRQS